MAKPFTCYICKRKKSTVYYYVKTDIKRPKEKDSKDICPDCAETAIEKGYKPFGLKPKG